MGLATANLLFTEVLEKSLLDSKLIGKRVTDIFQETTGHSRQSMTRMKTIKAIKSLRS